MIPTRELLRIEIVNREVVPINEIHLICKWELGGKDFKLDLIPFRLREFGVVLKMDWLSSNGAQIDYKGKKVKIRMPNGKEILIKSQRQTHIFLNIAQAKQLLRKDSKAYLAYVAGTKREAPMYVTYQLLTNLRMCFPKTFQDYHLTER